MLTIDMNRWKQSLFDRHWWRGAFACAWQFAPQCIKPAAVLTGANLISVGATAGFYFSMHRLQQNPSAAEIGILLAVSIGILLSMVAALCLAFWALFDWLVKLTAFSLGFMSGGGDPASWSGSLQAVAARKGYLMKLWLVASTWLLLPAMPLSLLIGFNMVLGGRQPMLDRSQLPLPWWLLDARVQLAAQIGGAALTVVLLAYTFVTMAFSAVSKEGPARTAFAGLKETFKHIVPLSLVTAAISVANILLTAPQMLVGLTDWAQWVHHPLVEAVAQIWLGISSTVIWPLSLAPFCLLVPCEEEVAASNG